MVEGKIGSIQEYDKLFYGPKRSTVFLCSASLYRFNVVVKVS